MGKLLVGVYGIFVASLWVWANMLSLFADERLTFRCTFTARVERVDVEVEADENEQQQTTQYRIQHNIIIIILFMILLNEIYLYF